MGLLAGCGAVQLPWQQRAKVPRVGLLLPGAQAGSAANVEAFSDGLRDLGYVEGQNVLVEARFAEGSTDRLADLATELVRLPVDVLAASTTPAIQAAMRASDALPIVMMSSGDPSGAKLVASLARPGGNVTGVSTMATELSGKRLELLKAAVPGATRAAALWNTADDGMNAEYGETLIAARALGIELRPLGARTPDDLDRAYEAAASAGAQMVVVMQDPFILQNRPRLVDLSARSRLPTISGDPRFAAAGGLMTYGPNPALAVRRMAYFVDKILKGAAPGDLPVVDHVQASLELLADHHGDRLRDARLQRGRVIGLAAVARPQQLDEVRRARQAAGVGGQDPIGAALHPAS
jgi:putative ABC transport system substrate-binding protein